jgi:hypothetical protein
MQAVAGFLMKLRLSFPLDKIFVFDAFLCYTLFV